MRYNRESIHNLIKYIELYIYQQWSVEVDIEILNYTNDGVKFHEWSISSIAINDKKYTKIRLSDGAIDDLIKDINNHPFESVISLDKDIFVACLM